MQETVLIQNLQAGNYQQETPTRVSNTVYTLSAAPSPAASLYLFVDGGFRARAGVDYTLAGSTITFALDQDANSVIRAYYLRDA